MPLFGKRNAPAEPPEPSGRYDGPFCFVDRNQDGPDGAQLEAGWHYSTRMWTDERGREHEIPHRKLYLNTEDDPASPFYEHAEPHHLSWVQRHGEGELVVLGNGETARAPANPDN